MTVSEQQQRELATASASLLVGMSDDHLRLFTDGTVAMLEAIKQEWDRRLLDRATSGGRA